MSKPIKPKGRIGVVMDEVSAEKILRRFLAESIQIFFHENPPAGTKPYAYNPEKDYLFSFRLYGEDAIGAGDYAAVSKSTGNVRYLWRYGE